ncbi:MAG TPA: YihY/virulence factor BrkB family protein [Acidimicrobiales bacterium]|nr:YihY/virulence factor BrkB family protein [Acidimicrobiales bacterium]
MRTLVDRLLDRLPGPVGEIVRALVHEWEDDRVPGVAAEVAFFGLLGLFPSLLAVAATLGSLDGLVGQDLADQTREAVVDWLQRFLTAEAGSTVQAVEDLFQEASPGALTTGVVVALWAASRGFTAVVNGLDVVYDLEERRPWLRRRLVALGLALGTVVVVAALVAMLVVGPLLGSGAELAERIGAGRAFAAAWDWARWPAMLVALAAWTATIFHLAPNHRTPWRADVPGAVLTTGLWVLLSVGLRAYLALAPGSNQVLGALGGVLIVLLWLYLLAVGLLLGGELNAILLARARAAAPARER